MAAARRLGDRRGEASALNDLGILRYLTGDYQIAAETLETALTIYRDLGDRLGQANYRRIGAAEAGAVSAELDALRNAPSPAPADPQELPATREHRRCPQEGAPALRVLTPVR